MRMLVGTIFTLVAHLAWAGPADTVFKNGEFYTVNDKQPWVQALAISGGRIVFAGQDRDVENYIGPDTRVVDLQGRMAMPGVHDAHIHLLYGGRAELGCKIPS